MYANKAAVAIKVNGRVLREHKDTVYIPFGSEYSILIKNLNSKRAIFNVFIDGENVVPGGLVLNAGQEIDLERSIKNNNLKEGNKFKFIERTSDIEEYRGIKLEDGLVRIEYQFEIDYPKPLPYRPTPYTPAPSWPYDKTGYPYTGPIWTTNSVIGSDRAMMSASNAVGSCNMAVGSAATSMAASASINDAGITVPGSKSEQKFRSVSGFTLEPEKHVMVFKILGETAENKPVTAPVTVKHKPKCVTCGTTNKATAKFCSKCGTALEIFA